MALVRLCYYNWFLSRRPKSFPLRAYASSGLEVIYLEYSLKLKIEHNDWLLADTCPQATNHCDLF